MIKHKIFILIGILLILFMALLSIPTNKGTFVASLFAAFFDAFKYMFNSVVNFFVTSSPVIPTTASYSSSSSSSSSSDLSPTHTVCDNVLGEAGMCSQVEGEGEDQCSSDEDCEMYTHMECLTETATGIHHCSAVGGWGEDGCSADADCQQQLKFFK